jgi:DNA repair protein SbcD/Mre11
MKILHLSDLHLGKSLNDTPLFDDQRHALAQALHVIEEKHVDVVAITGDVYDRAVPPPDAQLMLEDFVYECVGRLGASMVVIPGNHDSAVRIGFARKLLAPSRVYIASAECRVDPVVIHDEHGPVTFYPVPYIAPPDFRTSVGDGGTRSFTDIYDALFAGLTDVPARSVCLAHCFAANGNPTGDSDEKPLWIGGVQVTEPRVFERFGLTLLGHLHRPQCIGRKIYYAGSLLPYTFNDGAGAKKLVVYDVDAAGGFTRDEVDLVPLRRIRRLQGPFDVLLAAHTDPAPCPDLVEITVTEDRPPIDYRDRLKAVYPLAMVRQWVAPAPDAALDILDDHVRRSRTDEQVVHDFFASVSVPLDDDDRALMADVLNELLQHEREA